MHRRSSVQARLGAAMLPASAVAVLWATSARGHGEDELLLFTYLAEEPNLLRLSAGFMGTALLLLGLYIVLAGKQELKRSGGAQGAPDVLRLVGPGALIAGVGTLVLLTALLILPERLRPSHEHPEKPQAAAPLPPAAPGGPRGPRGY